MLKPVDDPPIEGGTMRPPAQRPDRRPMFPIEARGLTVRDGGRTLLDRATLSLQHGSRTVIMGPNGAGKSLLMRVLHGLVSPNEGGVTWAGRAADAEVLSRQAMVFQKPMLLRRSARANIAFVLRHLDRVTAAARVDEILTRARLSHVAASPARLLSGGEQQRLAIARGLALDPDLIFLDEPCANLDPASTLAVEDMIEDAHKAGAKIVLVTHDIGQARRIADDVVFMSSGRVLEHSAASAFFAKPQSAAADAYLSGRLYVDGPAPGR